MRLEIIGEKTTCQNSESLTLLYRKGVERERERERETLGVTTLCQQWWTHPSSLAHTHFSNHEDNSVLHVFHHPSDKNKNNQPTSKRNSLVE
jgi:hypothetical protein